MTPFNSSWSLKSPVPGRTGLKAFLTQSFTVLSTCCSEMCHFLVPPLVKPNMKQEKLWNPFIVHFVVPIVMENAVVRLLNFCKTRVTMFVASFPRLLSRSATNSRARNDHKFYFLKIKDALVCHAFCRIRVWVKETTVTTRRFRHELAVQLNFQVGLIVHIESWFSFRVPLHSNELSTQQLKTHVGPERQVED